MPQGDGDRVLGLELLEGLSKKRCSLKKPQLCGRSEASDT